MNRIRPRIPRRQLLLLATLLIVLGGVLLLRYSQRSYQAYRELHYIRENGLDQGDPDPTWIRPWMNLRYIAVIYAVPQEHLFIELGLPIDRASGQPSLFELARRLEPHQSPEQITARVRLIVTNYRADPFPLGLSEQRVWPWMSLQYVINSTGIPSEVLLAAIAVPDEGNNLYISLAELSARLEYPGGIHGLTTAVQEVITPYTELTPEPHE